MFETTTRLLCVNTAALFLSGVFAGAAIALLLTRPTREERQ